METLTVRSTAIVFLVMLVAPVLASGPGGSGIKLAGHDTGKDYPASEVIMSSVLPGGWFIDMDPEPASRNFSTSAGRLNLESELLSAPVYMSFDAAFAIRDYYPGLRDSGTGLSFSLDGQIGLGNGISLFGRSTWLTEIPGWGTPEVLPDRAFTTGILLNPQPNLSIRAGYRRFSLDPGDHRGTSAAYSTQGLFLGTGINW